MLDDFKGGKGDRKRGGGRKVEENRREVKRKEIQPCFRLFRLGKVSYSIAGHSMVGRRMREAFDSESVL